MRGREDEATLRRDAAAWLIYLLGGSVTVETIGEFQDWRDQPGHDVAYRDILAAWVAAGSPRTGIVPD